MQFLSLPTCDDGSFEHSIQAVGGKKQFEWLVFAWPRGAVYSFVYRRAAQQS